MNTLQKFEAKQLSKYQEQKEIPNFAPGDTIKVNVRIKEGTRERIQAFEGVCIARQGSGVNENFTVRKISYGEGVERVFPLWSSRIDSIELVRRGSVRRAKLYYLRDLRGKAARISERTTGHGIEVEEKDTSITKTAMKKAKKAEKQARRDEIRKEQEAKKKEAEKAAKEAADAEAKAAAEAQAAETEAPAEDSNE